MCSHIFLRFSLLLAYFSAKVKCRQSSEVLMEREYDKAGWGHDLSACVRVCVRVCERASVFLKLVAQSTSGVNMLLLLLSLPHLAQGNILLFCDKTKCFSSSLNPLPTRNVYFHVFREKTRIFNKASSLFPVFVRFNWLLCNPGTE